MERWAMAGSIPEVLLIAVALSDPAVGCTVVGEGLARRPEGCDRMPDAFRELTEDVPPGERASFIGLYRHCVLEAAGAEWHATTRTGDARYFGITALEIYARTYCKGDQSRFAAQAAYDFTFWWISTQPVPVMA